MPVLCEAISVVIKRESIDRYYKGEWDEFLNIVPNTTMCTDGDLVRVGFMSPQHVEKFIYVLQSGGLQFLNQKRSWVNRLRGSSRQQDDIIVVDQNQGPTMPCDWIEFGKVRMGADNIEVAFAWLLGERSFAKTANDVQINENQLKNFVTPEGWDLENSGKINFAPSENPNQRFQFLRTENELDIFWDTQRKTEVYTPVQNKPV